MQLKPLTVAAGLLAVPATNAFLLPPEVSDADIQVANAIESVGAEVAQIQAVYLECPDCPILVKGRRGRPIQLSSHHRTSHLQLTFTIDRQPDHDRLLVNDFELFPAGDPLGQVLLAPQTVDWGKEKEWMHHHREHDHHEGGRRKHDHDDDEHRHHGDEHDHHKPDHHDGERRKRPHRLTPQPQRLGFGLHVAPAKKAAEGPFDFIDVELQVLEVGVTFVDSIPNLKVKLIKDSEGRLLMSAIEGTEPKKLITLPDAEPEECTTVMCKLASVREMLRQKLENLRHFNSKPCGGRPRPGFPELSEAPGFHHPPHHHHHPHGPGAEQWPARFHEHRWGKLFKHIASHILLPVLIGIVAGVSISLIGMAVGTVVVSLWRIFFRRPGHRHHHGHHRRRSSRSHHHKAPRKEAAFEDEKSGLMEYQDSPPEYEEEETAKAPQV